MIAPSGGYPEEVSFPCAAKVYFLTYPQMAKELALKRLEEAKAVGAEVLVSACPTVKAHLTVASSGQTILLIRDVTELLLKLFKGKSSLENSSVS